MKRRMMRWLYDFGFFFFAIFSLPHFWSRLKQAGDSKRLLRERFGFLPEDWRSQFGEERPLWIHAVSVGEVLAAEKLIRLLLEKKPELPLVITTVTPTGQQIAKKWEGKRLRVAYFPFDFRFAVRRFFERLRPVGLLLVETEIWPNVIEEAKRRDIPMAVVNARLSVRSFRAFQRFSGIFRPLLHSIDSFLVQTEKDRERFLALGVHPENVRVTGNMKLDAFEENGKGEKERAELREQWGFLPSDLVLIGGSTHDGEEEILLRALRLLQKENLPVKLLLAPRHIERSAKIFEQVKPFGFKPILATRRGRAVSSPPWDVLILDKLGELRKLYAAGDAVFMGGSLIRHGGQNPIEPAAACRAILHGPWVFNFEEIYRRLHEEGGAIEVKGEEELFSALKQILTNSQERNKLGNRAYDVLEKLRGATQRHFNFVSQWIGVQHEVG